ncbi:MAG: hypothetical protein H6907_11220 [Hyphomicrobiales bacterium]|nr:hypothetical protein [Hyphomicrobiales bacterium]MCP5372291.1 hypothetical protein [Hyphomicrobiales bacterium]
MANEVFADGIGELGIAGGVVRINLVALSPTEKDANGQPVREFRQRLLMTPQGVLELHAGLQNMLDQLVEAGVLHRRDQKAAAEDRPAKGNGGEPKTPNF